MSEHYAEISETDLEICYSRAIISCFTLFFPEKFRKKLLAYSSKYLNTNQEALDGLINDFIYTEPFKTIESLQNIYVYYEKEPLAGLGLYSIFKTLFSNEIEDDERAKLIPTFRALRLTILHKYSDAHFLDQYINSSYELFCEVTSHSGKETNFLSDNICGSLVDSKIPNETNSTQNYLKQMLQDRQMFPDRAEILFCDKIDLKWEEFKLTTIESRITFITELYKGLRDFSDNPTQKKYKGVGVLNFPLNDAALPPPNQLKQDPKNPIRYYPPQCNLENFVNMFNGITEDRPYRTELCKKTNSKSGANYCLSCFITALHCPKGNRDAVAKGFQELLVSSGRPLKDEYLRTSSRNRDLVKAYEAIIDQAIKRAKGKYTSKYKNEK